jgi:hypothetical protein
MNTIKNPVVPKTSVLLLQLIIESLSFVYSYKIGLKVYSPLCPSFKTVLYIREFKNLRENSCNL